MLLSSKNLSITILIFTCLLPSLSLAQSTKDDKVGGNLQVTEIRRVMNDGEVNAKNHHTKIVMTGVGEITGTVNCTLVLREGPLMVNYYATVTDLETEVIFEKPLLDADLILLIISDSKGVTDSWTGHFIIKDLKARVAVVGSSDNNNNYLRVTTGEYLDTVRVDDAHECRNEDSPCYYRQKTLTISDPSMIERCIKLSSTDPRHENDTLLHCDDTYSDFIAISEKTEPTRLLLEDTLHLIYLQPSVAAEVVIVDPNTGDLISNDPNGYNCTNNEEGCSIDLKTEERQNINLVVVFDDDDYVDASMTYPFEIFEVAMMQLTSDAAMATWSPSASGTFDVLITTREALVEPNYYCNRECNVSDAKNGVKCEAFFIILYEEGKEYFAIIRPEENNGKNAIGILISKGFPLDPIKMEKIARTPEAEIKTTVTFDSTTKPKSMKLIEITTNSAEVTITEYFGDVSETLNKYKFQSSKDIGGFDRDRHFLLVRYDRDGDVFREVGEVLVTWRISSVQLDWVGEPSGNFSALREVVESGTTLIQDKYHCEATLHPCYFLEFSYGSESLLLCTTITNEATGDNIDVCDYVKPNNPSELNVTKLVFTKRENLDVTTEYDVLTEVNLMWYVTRTDPSSEAECKFSAMETDNEISECTVKFGKALEGNSSLLKVLLVRIDRSSGNVTESSVLLVDDLKFLNSKLSRDSLMVKWTGIHKKYTATLLDISSVVNDQNRVMTKDTALICDEENMCYAHFFDLSPSHDYSLLVQKKYDEVTILKQKFVLERVPVEEGEDLGMTKITKLDSTTTKIVLNATITSGTISVVMNQSTYTDETAVLKRSGVNNNTFQFTLESPIFDVPKKVDFIILAQKEHTKYKGLVLLNFKDLDTNVAWVGAERGKANASLRVDTGNQPSVKVGDKTCLKDYSPCYFIEDQSLPEIIERCLNLEVGSKNEKVEQCDEEINSYKELKVTNISLEDDQINVTVAADSSQVKMEVIIYDPKDSNNIISTGETDCDSEVEDNEEIMTCIQALNIPSDRTPVKVLVSEINDGGIVLKSSLLDFSFPDDSRPPNTGTDTWIIVVSVLASVPCTFFIVFIIVFVVKKLHKSKDNWIERKLNVFFRAKQHDAPQHTLPPPANRVRIYDEPKESHHHLTSSDDPHDGPLYTIPPAHRTGFFDDSHPYPQPKESSHYSKGSDAPQAASRKNHSPYSRNCDFPRNVDSPHSGHYDSPHSSDYENMTDLFPTRAENNY